MFTTFDPKTGLGIDPDLYHGVFTHRNAPGALYLKDSLVRKRWSAEGDATPTGSLGKVIGSVDGGDLGIGYFVEWLNRRGVAVAVMEGRLAPED